MSKPYHVSDGTAKQEARKASAKSAEGPEAAEPESNFIEFASAQSPAGSGRPWERSADKEARGTLSFGRASSPVPDLVLERFINVGSRFYFPDGADAFTDHGNRLTTRSENTVVIQSMVAIARERSKGEITVKGSEYFRKEAWFAASLAGLEVHGYEPSQFEKERLARALVRREQIARENTSSKDPPEERTGPVNGVSPKPAEAQRPGPFKEEVITGWLVDQGPLPADGKDKSAKNFYVRIETEQGDVERWGPELEQAFRHSLSRPGIGDQVTLRLAGPDPFDRTDGREKPANARSQWIVETKEFLEGRAVMAQWVRDMQTTPAETLQRYPQLQGSFDYLEAGRDWAQQNYKSTRQREQFMRDLQEKLAKNIEYGRPLQAGLARQKTQETREPQVQDRDYAPSR